MKYEDALQDIDILKISSSVLKKYTNLLNNDELEQCRQIGIWRACTKYDKYKAKLTTYIYNYVNWECLKLISETKIQICNKPPKNINGIDIFTQLKVLLSKEDFNIIYDKYVKNMTLKEIAESNHTSIRASYKSLKKSLSHVKKIFS